MAQIHQVFAMIYIQYKTAISWKKTCPISTSSLHISNTFFMRWKHPVFSSRQLKGYAFNQPSKISLCIPLLDDLFGLHLGAEMKFFVVFLKKVSFDVSAESCLESLVDIGCHKSSRRIVKQLSKWETSMGTTSSPSANRIRVWGSKARSMILAKNESVHRRR